jgi:RHS repeat-associated protein
VQETHYDPWGVELQGLGYQETGIKVNKYLYNGMEFNDHLGVNLFDYGARMYDAAIGRWFVVDPLANHPVQVDKSPYGYAWNNPVLFTDPDGRCPNGCSDEEKTGNGYAVGARVENKYGVSEWTGEEWVVISSTPDGSGSNSSTEAEGGGGSGRDSYESSGNGFFGSSGWGDMAGGFASGIGFGLTHVGNSISMRGYSISNYKTWKGKNGKIYSRDLLYKDYYGKGGKHVRGVQGLRNSSAIAEKSALKFTAFGRAVGGLGILTTAVGAGLDGEITFGDYAKIGIGALTVYTPYGWVYGVADFSTLIITGESITDRVGDFVDKHWE